MKNIANKQSSVRMRHTVFAHVLGVCDPMLYDNYNSSGCVPSPLVFSKNNLESQCTVHIAKKRYSLI